MSGVGSSIFVLLDVQDSSGEYETNITVKGEKWGDYFIYSDVLKTWVVMSEKIIIGNHTSLTNTTTLGVGQFAGYLNQHDTAVAIGVFAGNTDQKIGAIAIGTEAGKVTQQGIAIGAYAGQINQQPGAIAFGFNAGRNTQELGAISIGANAGEATQRSGAISIGANAGRINQGTGAIAIGANAGQTNQAAYSIVIGNNVNTLTTNTIVMNASSSPLIPSTYGLFIRPLMGPMIGNNLLSWNTATKEIFYNGSSERFKHDIKPLTSGESVYELKPREFKYKEDGSSDIGLIAEEAFYSNNAFAYLDKEGIPEGIQWTAITASLLKEIQEIKRRIKILKLKSSN
jgi:hypothetical protein